MSIKNMKFWKNKKVLVTGFEGFLGSHLTRAMLQSKARVIGLDIKTFRRETILCQQDYNKIIVYQGSVADRKLVRGILAQHAIDIVFHLAAEAIVSRSYTNPLSAFESNIAGTWEILEASRLQGSLRALIVASSDKAYGSHSRLPYRETAPLIANHPYDVSKGCADLLAYTYFYTYHLPVAITRCGNIYGEGDFNFSRLIPDAFRCLALNRKLKIRSDGKFVRDYIYVDDIVAGYMRIAELLEKRKLAGEAFNLSDEKPTTVIKILKEIEQVCLAPKKLNYEIMNTTRYEIKKQYLSAAKARRILGWKSTCSLREGLRKTGKWYMEHFKQR